MRKTLTYPEFKEIVGEETIEKIIECFSKGFEDSVELINLGNQRGIMVEYETRTKAGIAHDHIKARLKDTLQGHPFVEIGKWRGIFALKFGEEAFCRIKKFLTGSAQVSVALTPQQKKFNDQLPIDGFPERPSFVTLGYYADNPWTKILGVFASCWSADGLEWFYRLNGEGFSQLPLYVDNPTSPILPGITELPSDTPRRVKGKKTTKKDTGTDTGL